MEVKVLYFGMISEITNCSEEIISLQEGSNTMELENIVRNKYPNLHQLSFKIAIDQKISTANSLLYKNNEIALLPPFSGV